MCVCVCDCVSATVGHFHEVATLCFLLRGDVFLCSMSNSCSVLIEKSRFLLSRVAALEMKKEGKYCIWDPYNLFTYKMT